MKRLDGKKTPWLLLYGVQLPTSVAENKYYYYYYCYYYYYYEYGYLGSFLGGKAAVE
jgi:hypothetical protein